MSAAEVFGRLARGELVIIDGGTGTELQAEGVPMDDRAWSARANLDQPDVVQRVSHQLRQIHRDLVSPDHENRRSITLQQAHRIAVWCVRPADGGGHLRGDGPRWAHAHWTAVERFALTSSLPLISVDERALHL
jgi:hypothetical protein